MNSLSIVIVNWNQANAAEQCLRGLAGWNRLAPEVWLVDNASTEDSARTLPQRFDDVRFVFNERNLGWGGGNNVALRQIDTPLVLLLNSDAEISEDGAARLLEHLEGDPELAAVAPMVEHRDETKTVLSAGGRDVSRHIRTHLRPEELESGSSEVGMPIAVDYVPGSAALWRTQVLKELGLFEESYFFGGEIAEICDRARDQGHRVAVAPDVVATHDVSYSSGSRASLYPYYILRNRFLFVRRRRGRSLALLAAWSLYGIAKAGTALLRGNPRDARLYALGLIDGVLDRSGNQNSRVQSA